jgi:hypothetical protein
LETSAALAEWLARTLDWKADVLERLPGGHGPRQEREGRVTRTRRLAEALRAAAGYFRAGELPPEDIRAVIRNPDGPRPDEVF